MSFADRISRTPRPFEAGFATEAETRFGDLAPELRGLLRGTAGCSPYLRGLMERHEDWLREALAAEPEVAMARVMADMAGLADAELTAGLRLAKARMALLTGLADIGGVWSLEEVTGTLTRFADLAVARALRAQVAVEIGRGKLPGQTEADIDTAGGMVVLAMGKMGAHELNYSSDIDLICLFDETRFDPDAYGEARAGFVRATRRMAAQLSDLTGDGYVFRTDLRLRPDPSVTPVCMPMEGAIRYYESLGRTWERAAHIKARPSAGDLEAGAAYLEHLRPFIWRRHLDFAAIQDAHDMRLRIRSHKGQGGPGPLEGHDLKLGRGGIREIEFFTQTRQIIAGGRDQTLRVRGTLEGLSRLVAAGWVPEDVATQLTDDYRAHREAEHRVQMIADAQTHCLPNSEDGLQRLACFMDRDLRDLRREFAERFDRVAGLTEVFFAPARKPAPTSPELTEAQHEIVTRWRSYSALRSERALDIFDRIKPALLSRLLTGARPDQALLHFDGFLRGLPAGVQLFSLFEANPQLIALIADIADSAPDLAQHLSRNAGVLDAVLGGSFFEDWPGQDALEIDLQHRIGAARDYETQLDRARGWAKEWHFRTGVHHLRGLIDGVEAGAQYADLARAVLAVLWPVVIDAFAVKHGPPPGLGAMVLAMGSVGAGQLTARSDLDLIVIYDADGVDASEGKRPLTSRVYYARLTQALVTALSAPTAEGKLYEVDMRLRPSGRQGPVATARAAFESYQREQAWTWEHLALTRATPVAGPRVLTEEIEAFRRDLLMQHRDAARVLGDVADMRARLARAKPASGEWDMKAGPGRLQDIELLATAMALLSGSPERKVPAQLHAGVAAGLLGADVAAEITQAHGVFARLRAAGRLLEGGALNLETLCSGGEALILRETGARDMPALVALVEDHAARVAAHMDRIVGTGDDKGEATDSTVAEANTHGAAE